MSDNSQCKTCKRKFGSQRAANQHMDSVNHWIPALECDDQKSLVQRFAELYTGNNPQEPDKSTVPRSETVTATPELQHHTSTQLLEDTKNRQPQFQCKICKKSFLTQRSLDQHLENTGHEGPQFKCDTCDGKFTSQSSANQHMDAKSHHKRHTCPDCKKGFKSENALNMHVNMTTHRDKKVAHPSPSQESITKPHPEHCQNGDRKTLQSAPRVPQLKPPHVEQTTSPSQMYPLLHEHIAIALAEHAIPDHFHNINSDEGMIRRYSTYIMGTFTCQNKSCPRGTWGSGKVAILIRKYPNNRYNAAVYNQRCQHCNKLGRLLMDEQSYIDRVSYRLKKWAGISEELPFYPEKGTPPHREDLCEGCKAGICGMADMWN